jgi:hypothetical protein
MLLGDRCIVLYSLVLKRFNWMCILLSGINIVMRFMIYRVTDTNIVSVT